MIRHFGIVFFVITMISLSATTTEPGTNNSTTTEPRTTKLTTTEPKTTNSTTTEPGTNDSTTTKPRTTNLTTTEPRTTNSTTTEPRTTNSTTTEPGTNNSTTTEPRTTNLTTTEPRTTNSTTTESTHTGSTSTESTTPNSTITESTTTKPTTDYVLCRKTSERYRNAMTMFSNALKNMVTASLENKTMTAEESGSLKTVSTEFLAAMLDCPNYIKTGNESLENYIKLLEFSLKNATELIRGGHFKCIYNQKTNIQKTCVNTTAEKNLYIYLPKKVNLEYNLVTCENTKHNRKCVNNILMEECPQAANYVDSLFKFARNGLCNDTVNPTSAEVPEKSGSVRVTAAWATIAVLMFEWSNLIEFI